MSFSEGMTLRNVPSFNGPHAQTSPLHQVGDSFLSVFPSVGLAILDASLVWTGWAANGRGQIWHVGTTKVLIDSIIVDTEWAKTWALCPRVNAYAAALKTRKLKKLVSSDQVVSLAVGEECPFGGPLLSDFSQTQVLVVVAFPPLYLFLSRLVANQLHACQTTVFDCTFLYSLPVLWFGKPIFGGCILSKHIISFQPGMYLWQLLNNVCRIMGIIKMKVIFNCN